MLLVARFPQGENVRMFDKKQMVLRKVKGWVVTLVGAFQSGFSPSNLQVYRGLQQRFLLPPHGLIGLVTEAVKMDLRLHGQGICASAFFK